MAAQGRILYVNSYSHLCSTACRCCFFLLHFPCNKGCTGVAAWVWGCAIVCVCVPLLCNTMHILRTPFLQLQCVLFQLPCAMLYFQCARVQLELAMLWLLSAILVLSVVMHNLSAVWFQPALALLQLQRAVLQLYSTAWSRQGCRGGVAVCMRWLRGGACRVFCTKARNLVWFRAFVAWVHVVCWPMVQGLPATRGNFWAVGGAVQTGCLLFAGLRLWLGGF